MEFCLPKSETDNVRKALRDGTLNPQALRRLSSVDRRKKLAEVVGDDLAKEVNVLFEKNLLLKNQKEAMLDWARNLAGVTPERRKDMVDQILNLQRVLDPSSERAFLADLAESKLGTTVTAAEAKQLVTLSIDAQTTKSALMKDPWNTDLQIAYGDAYQALTKRVAELKDPGLLRIPKNAAEWGDLAVNVAGLAKQVVSNFDFSAPLIQTASLISNKRFYQGLPEMFRYFADEANYTRLKSEIIGHPYYPIAQKAKLGITELDGSLLRREEAISSNILEKLVQYGIDKSGFEAMPNPPAAFNRAFTGYTTYIRWKTYLDFLEAAKMAGEEVQVGSKLASDLANVVNNFSGRAGLGPLDQSVAATTGLNLLFWAPRKMVAVAQVLNPAHYALLTPTARKIALKQLASTVAATMAVWGLVKASGGDVDVDPRSQSFGTITLPGGKYRYDMTGGSAIYTRFIARLITGQIKTTTGKIHEMGDTKMGGKYNSMDDLIIPFFRGKFGPSAAMFADAMWGENAVGEEFNLQTQVVERTLIPMTIQTYIDIANDSGQGAADIMVLPLVSLGLGVRMPFRPMAQGLNALGEPDRLDTDEDTTTIFNALKEAGKTPYPAPNTILGVKLTDEQHTQYIARSGTVLKDMLLPIIKDESYWPTLTVEEKTQIFNDAQRMARKTASDSIVAESEGTDNDIRALAEAKKDN